LKIERDFYCRTAEAEAEPGANARSLDGMPPTWRVLMADDDAEICALIQTILRRGPYQLTVCNDAESALHHVERDEPFDLVICDFMLPGISGIELITRVRAHPASTDVPIVMISGDNDAAVHARAKAAGANVFLNKPFSLKQMRSTVESLLEARLPVVMTP
jgi:CheY-like chemotaxis protein